MKAQELRIGNYIIDEFGDEVRVSTIFPDTVVISDRGNNNILNELVECKPIPLTEDWLLKFGFTETHECYYQLNGLLLEHTASNNFNVNDCLCWISEVNQLQNLYFALTGEELTIKE
jgi:hypothetical protein